MTTAPEVARVHAQRIATAVTEQWMLAHGPSRLEVPVSVVASMALFASPQPAEDGARDPLYLLADLPLSGFKDEQALLWQHTALFWPGLHQRWECFAQWLNPHEGPLLGAAQSVAIRCLEAGLLDLVGDPARRRSVDLLGVVLHRLKSPMFTAVPDPLAPTGTGDEQHAAAIQPGSSVTLRRVWTGARLLPVLAQLRRRGLDPANVVWQLHESDELAAACLAVNTVLWGLGPHTVIGTGEEADWLRAAHQERAAALRRLHGPG